MLAGGARGGVSVSASRGREDERSRGVEEEARRRGGVSVSASRGGVEEARTRGVEDSRTAAYLKVRRENSALLLVCVGACGESGWEGAWVWVCGCGCVGVWVSMCVWVRACGCVVCSVTLVTIELLREP
jgi:hypothetical protein